MLSEPMRRLGFRNDGKDFDGFGRDVIKNSHLPNPEPILWLAQASQTPDPALARSGRLVSQVSFESVPHFSAAVSRQGSVGLCRFRREDDLISHLARL